MEEWGHLVYTRDQTRKEEYLVKSVFCIIDIGSCTVSNPLNLRLFVHITIHNRTTVHPLTAETYFAG